MRPLSLGAFTDEAKSLLSRPAGRPDRAGKRGAGRHQRRQAYRFRHVREAGAERPGGRKPVRLDADAARRLASDHRQISRTPVHGFPNETTAPPGRISTPPARIGRVGSSRKKAKLITCHTTKSVAM